MSTVVNLRPSPIGQLTVETVSELSQLGRIEGVWRQLEREAIGAVVFQSYDWCRIVWSTLAECAPREARAVRVVVVRDGDRPVLIWPLSLRRSFGRTVVQDLSEPFGQFSDALVAHGHDAMAAFDAAWAGIRGWRPDALVLRKVRADAAIAPWLAARGRCVGEPEFAPAIGLGGFPDFAAYKASIAAKTRKNLRNYRNRLSREGTLEHRVVSDPDDLRSLVGRCFAMREHWLAASGLSSTAFRHPAFQKLVLRLAEGGDGCPTLLMMHLTMRKSAGIPSIADADVAIQWGFEHQGRYYAFMSARNPEFDAFSPGRLHLEDVVDACAGRGIETIDLLVPDMPYKSTWATDRVQVDCYGIAASLSGRVLLDGWHGLARPAMKSLALRLPKAARSAVIDACRRTLQLPARVRWLVARRAKIAE